MKYFVFKLLEKPGPYPMVILPHCGGYWMDGVRPSSQSDFDCETSSVLSESCSPPKLEIDETASCYRKYFMDKVSSSVWF